MADQWLKREQKSPTEYTETHPSYGCIGLNQSSGRGVLFGSEVVHQHFISLTISEARRVVDEPREFVMPERELIQVEMTQAQFAEMITSPNRGGGTPCTIARFTGDDGEPWVHPRHGGRPSPPDPEPYTQRYKSAMGERADKVVEFIAKAKSMIDELMDGKTKPTKATLGALQSALHMAKMNIESNLPYVMEEMEEGIEKRMATAINEFESYVAFSLQTKGLQHLAADAPRLNAGDQKSLTEGTDERSDHN
jgi:hypothetical protein